MNYEINIRKKYEWLPTIFLMGLVLLSPALWKSKISDFSSK